MPRMDAGTTKGTTMAAGPANGKSKTRTGAHAPVPPKTRAAIIALARAGELSRNAIARQFKLSPSTITRICQAAEPPVSFDRGAIAPALAAVQADFKAQRTEMAQLSLEHARRLYGKMTEPHTVIGWYQGLASEHTIPEPTSGDVKNYAIALGILLDKHAMLVKFDSDDRDLPAVDKWLEAMMAGPPASLVSA